MKLSLSDILAAPTMLILVWHGLGRPLGRPNPCVDECSYRWDSKDSFGYSAWLVPTQRTITSPRRHSPSQMMCQHAVIEALCYFDKGEMKPCLFQGFWRSWPFAVFLLNQVLPPKLCTLAWMIDRLDWKPRKITEPQLSMRKGLQQKLIPTSRLSDQKS